MAVEINPATTLGELLEQHATERGTTMAFRFLRGSQQREETITFSGLATRAHAIAAHLNQHGLGRGTRVMVMYPAGLDYICALLGCIVSGATAVPAYPLGGGRGLSRAAQRIAAVIADSGAEAALGLEGDLEPLRALPATGACRLLPVHDVQAAPPGWRPPELHAEDGCILQYTSGSTSTPRGVLVSHDNLSVNEHQIHAVMETRADDVLLSWLPPFHDMGLIGGVFGPLYAGVPGIHMAPEAFMRKPARWLHAVSRCGASILLAPNFAFDLCVRRVSPAERATLDLSSVRLCFTGAEPINPDTLDRFVAAFGPHGFRRSAIFPAYGLAEATLLVTGSEPNTPPRVETFDGAALERGRVSPSPDRARGRRIVSSGRAGPGTEVRIVDPDTCTPTAHGRVGEIWVRGPAVAQGYWQDPEHTRRTFGATIAADGETGYLRTGDLGFVEDGELFVAGRRKEVIIVRGRNFYPHDVERAVQELDPALVQDGGAAFGIDTYDGEQLVIVQEFDKRIGHEATAVLARIPDAIQAEFGIVPAAVVLIKRGQMLKTSSAKIQRRAVKQAWTADDFTVTAIWQTPKTLVRADAEATEGPSIEEDVADEEAHANERQPRVSPILPPPPTSGVPRAAVHATTPGEANPRDTQSVISFLTRTLAERLGLATEDIDPRASLAQYGADSLLLAELTEELERWLGRPLPANTTYDNPSIAELAKAILALDRGLLHGVGPQTQPRSARGPRTRPRGSEGARRDDPIAIVGMGCRFPGADNPEALWRLLEGSVDATSDLPAWRWDMDQLHDPEPRVRGKMCTRRGGFLAGIDEFDPAFFGVSKREADRMDPQQRLMLEVAWEALEDACIDPTSLAGSETGVFVGASSNDYAVLYGGDLQLIDGDYGTGNSTGIIANRLSYFLNLQGPSLTLDTACASSLVALDTACAAIGRGDCDLAIVGASNAVLAPEASVYFSQAGMLSPSGKCRSFDASADGFVRSEGVGVVVIARQSNAERLGARVRALIAGIAVNHTGQANGLVAPNGQAQQRVIGRALARAGIDARDLDYIEAHGVGTPVSDAVEVAALGALMKESERQQPCLLGSVKTNLGHLEAAAGMAALIKTTLALEHEQIPAHLHLEEPHPHLGLEQLPLEIPTVATPWPRDTLGRRRRYAGVSAFGFGGANAHAVLTEAPPDTIAPRRIAARDGMEAAEGVASTGAMGIPECERPLHLALLSGHTEIALEAAITRLAHTGRRATVGDICHTLAEGRAHFRHRRAVLLTGHEHLQAQLQEFLPADSREIEITALAGVGERARPRTWQGEAPAGEAPGVALIFDEGPLTSELLSALARTHPVAQQAFEATARQAATLGVRNALRVLDPASGTAWLQGIKHRDVARFAMHRALFELFALVQIEPESVLGQGAGEYSAACAAGALPWNEGLALVIQRADTLASLQPGTTVRMTRRQFNDATARAPLSTPRCALLLGSAGETCFGPDHAPDGGHFARQLLHTPGPQDGMALLAARAVAFEVTLGPSHDGRQPSEGTSLSLLAANADPWTSLLGALGQLYVGGVVPRLSGLDGPFGYRMCGLPHYPFERRKCWLEFPERQFAGEVRTPSTPPVSHPLLKAVHTVTRRRSGFASSVSAPSHGDDQTG